jgi:hypothetical protein
MKKHSQIQRLISVLMIFILLPYFSGCTITKKVISKSDLPLPDSSKYAYIVHGERSNFLLEKSTIANGILSGRIKQIFSDESYNSGNKIHLYLSSDSVIRIDTGSILSVPLNEVTVVELVDLSKVPGAGKHIIIISGFVLAMLLVVGLIGFLNWHPKLPPLI